MNQAMPPLAGRHLVSIFDLSNEEIGGLFRLADRFTAALGGGPLSLVRTRRTRRRARAAAGRAAIGRLCAGQLLATVFFEPSTRTRLSFESAMLRLGGRVISVADPRSSSAAKGERLSDTVRVIASYADIMVLRHPHEGAALLAAESLDEQRLAELGRRVPIINGGDGAHEHPTQTLCDLYTILREHKRIAGLSIAVCGDLLHARTVHSLVYGLARFGARLKCISPPELRLPPYVKRRLAQEFNCTPAEYDSFSALAAPDREQALPPGERRRRTQMRRLMPSEDVLEAVGRLVDAVYLTRIQRERFADPARADAVSGSYLVDLQALQRIGRNTTIMHPLPRVDELDLAVDTDTRAAYFRQASYGVPIRMALMALLLGKKTIGRAPGAGASREMPLAAGEWVRGVRCANATCITNNERGASPRMRRVGAFGLLRCDYCEQEQEAPEPERRRP
jgi:aspartate carbamoyltransferase catalytic subunit